LATKKGTGNGQGGKRAESLRRAHEQRCATRRLIRQETGLRLRMPKPPEAAEYFPVAMDPVETYRLLGEPSAGILSEWLSVSGFAGIRPATLSEKSPPGPDEILAAALRYAAGKYPDAPDLDVCSFATLVQRLATGSAWGMATSDYLPERQAELVVLAALGRMDMVSDAIPIDENVKVSLSWPKPDQPVGPQLTRSIFAFLEAFYFADREAAVQNFLSLMDTTGLIWTVLRLARAGADGADVAGMVDRGELLTTQQVANMYGLAGRNVLEACRKGNLGRGAANITVTWLITRAAAHREWGYRLVYTDRGGQGRQAADTTPAPAVGRRVVTVLYNKRGKADFRFSGTIADLVARHAGNASLGWDAVGRIEEHTTPVIVAEKAGKVKRNTAGKEPESKRYITVRLDDELTDRLNRAIAVMSAEGFDQTRLSRSSLILRAIVVWLDALDAGAFDDIVIGATRKDS